MKNRREGLRERKNDGITYCNMFWLFMFGNVLGVLLEGTWCKLCFGHWETHVVTIWGPFCLIYGIGAVMFYISGEIVRSTGFRGVLARFCLISVVATVFEARVRTPARIRHGHEGVGLLKELSELQGSYLP